MPRYRVNEASQREIQTTVRQVKDLTRLRTETSPDDAPTRATPSDPTFIDFGKITAAGADSTHWVWKASLRDSSTGNFTEGEQGSADLGECVIADGAAGAVGMKGLLYWQEGSDGATVIVMVPLAETSEIVVRVDSDATGGGFYNGYIVAPPTSDVDGTTDLAASDVGADSEACLIMDLMAIGSSAHDLTDAANTSQKHFIGHLRRINSDGTKVIAINGFFTGCEAT